MASSSTKYSYSDTFDVTSADHSALSQGSSVSASVARNTHNEDGTRDRSDYSSGSHKTYTHGYSLSDRSSVSDTLTYHSDDSTRQEGYTDVEDLYSDTFEETGIPTETGRSDQEHSKSYLETVRSSTNTFQESLSSKSYLESVASSGTTLQGSHGSRSYLESVASSDYTSKQEQRYLDESFESPSPTGTSLDLHTYDMTESHIFGPATEEIRELSAEDLRKAEAFEARENFINHCIGKLRESRLLQALPDMLPVVVEAETKLKPESEEQRKFCRRKIHQVKQQKYTKGIKPETDIARKQPRIDTTPVEAYGLGSAVMDRLKLENVIKKMKKLTTEEIHDVRKCKLCRKQQKKLEEAEAKKQFLKYHSCRLCSKEVDISVENHLTRMTTVNMIGEILQDMPGFDECSDELLYKYKTRVLNQMKIT